MNSFATLVIKLRWVILWAVTLLTVFLGYQLSGLRINADILSSLPGDDPAAALYKEIGQEFGGNAMGMIALETGNVFTTATLQHVKQVTDSLRTMAGVSTVTSLTNIIAIRGEEWGIEIGKLVDEYELPDTEAELARLRQRVLANNMYRGAIVSADATTTLIIYTTYDDVDQQAIARQVKLLVTGLGLPEKLYFAGLPMMMNDVSDLILLDIIKLVPIVFVVIAAVLFFSFRSLQGVILPLLTAAIAIVWALGIMGLLGYEMTIISNNIPIILFAVGSAYTIHVLNRVTYTTTKNHRAGLATALAYITVPVFLAAITTIIGFVSFIFGAYLLMIRDFGIFTALGTFWALLLSVTLVPALLAVFPGRGRQAADSNRGAAAGLWARYLLRPVTRLLFSRPQRIMLIWGVLLCVAAAGIFRIKRSVNMQNYFTKDNPTRVAEDVMQRKFGGSQPVYLVFTGNMQSPAVLKLMAATEAYMKQFAEVTTTQSVAGLIARMNEVMGEGYRIPDEQEKIAQLWFLLDGQDIMAQLVSPNLDKGIIQSRFSSYDSKKMQEFVDYMDGFIVRHATPGCQVQLTGMPSVYVRMDKSLFNSQMSSLGIALVLVLVIVGLILRSFARGLYAVIPILATITILYGFMGYAGISLDVATVLVASVALGIGIDYSIHIITHYNHAMQVYHATRPALTEAILTSGKAIVINVMSVAAGFLVLLFSQMVPLQNFGLLVALSMAGSGLGALTLLPVVLILREGKQVHEKEDGKHK